MLLILCVCMQTGCLYRNKHTYEIMSLKYSNRKFDVEAHYKFSPCKPIPIIFAMADSYILQPHGILAVSQYFINFINHCNFNRSWIWKNTGPGKQHFSLFQGQLWASFTFNPSSGQTKKRDGLWTSEKRPFLVGKCWSRWWGGALCSSVIWRYFRPPWLIEHHCRLA